MPWIENPPPRRHRERLSLLDASLRYLVQSAPDERVRAAATAIAIQAVRDTGLEAEFVNEIDKLQKGDTVDPEPVAVLQRQLDEAYWSEQELVEGGEPSDGAVIDRFRKARAANALLFALNDDATHACTEAAYEAFHAYPDGQVVLDGSVQSLPKCRTDHQTSDPNDHSAECSRSPTYPHVVRGALGMRRPPRMATAWDREGPTTY